MEEQKQGPIAFKLSKESNIKKINPIKPPLENTTGNYPFDTPSSGRTVQSATDSTSNEVTVVGSENSSLAAPPDVQIVTDENSKNQVEVVVASSAFVPSKPSVPSISSTESMNLEEPITLGNKCLLCKRQFQSVQTLQKHIEMSDLHKAFRKLRLITFFPPFLKVVFPFSKICRRDKKC
eukprot:TRINITY_DN2248_c0_g1_i2.p1 TRINITY_DN2248_c0_g1~~TRINITY_DN2248_c0_g1_i2.p1  ORF type:complete len:179 (+),score=26.55 TRINITY_DN2248_c0_g1_i2:201-737(+)